MSPKCVRLLMLFLFFHNIVKGLLPHSFLKKNTNIRMTRKILCTLLIRCLQTQSFWRGPVWATQSDLRILFTSFFCPCCTGLAISDKKNYSAENGKDGTTGLFRQNSGHSSEQKFRGVLFRLRYVWFSYLPNTRLLGKETCFTKSTIAKEPKSYEIALHTVTKNYKIPGFYLTKPSWDWDCVNYSQPGRVL